MLRKTRGNMFGFIDYTLNPVSGKCPHLCSYCYMKKLWQSDLKLNKSAFNQILPSDKFIFIGSGTDMFCKEMPEDYITKSLNFLSQYRNRYLFQTKNPARYKEFLNYFPENSILGTTVETNKQELINSNAPTVKERVEQLSSIPNFEKTITFEPLMDFDIPQLLEMIKEVQPTYVTIGAVTGDNFLPEPSKKKVDRFIELASELTEVETKHNLNRIIQ